MRTKRILQNFVSDVAPQLIIAALGLFKMKVFLDYLGEEQLGLYQLYGQIIAYVVLIEGGAAMAVLFRLYEPLAKKDKEKVNIIASTSKYVFNMIGFAIIAIGAIVALNIGFIVDAQTVTLIFVKITFFIFLLSQVVLYFFVTERSVFDADQKRYIPNLIYQTATIVKSILEIIIVIFGGNLLAVVISLLIVNITSNLILYILFKKYYNDVRFDAKKDYSMLSDVKHLYVNSIGNLVANNIDVILISKYIGLTSVVIYTSYNYLINSLIQIIEKITGSTLASVADIIITEKKRAYSIFMEYNSFIFYIAACLCTPLLFAMNPFIDLWYEGKILTTTVLSILFTGILFYKIIKIPLHTFTFAAGMFEKVKKYVIIECIINVVLSLILIRYFSIAGILMATIIAFIVADYIPKSIVIHKEILEESPVKYHLFNLKYTVYIFGMCYLVSLLNLNMDNLFMWFIYSALIFIINFIITTLLFYINKDLSFLDRFNLKRFIGKKG